MLSVFPVVLGLLLVFAKAHAEPIIVWPLKTIIVNIKNSDQVIVLSPSIDHQDRFNVHVFEKSNGHVKAYGFMQLTVNGYVGFMKYDNGQIYKTYLVGNDIFFVDVSDLDDADKKKYARYLYSTQKVASGR